MLKFWGFLYLYIQISRHNSSTSEGIRAEKPKRICLIEEIIFWFTFTLFLMKFFKQFLHENFRCFDNKFSSQTLLNSKKCGFVELSNLIHFLGSSPLLSWFFQFWNRLNWRDILLRIDKPCVSYILWEYNNDVPKNNILPWKLDLVALQKCFWFGRRV